MAQQQPYDGVVVCAPVTVPYRRYCDKTAHWWAGRALKELSRQTGLGPADFDGFCFSSFSAAPDTVVGMVQHLGLSPRWMDHIPTGGASGVMALRRAARGVQAGDVDIVACVAADTNQIDSFRQTLAGFSRFSQDASYPYGFGGPNATFALITDAFMRDYGVTRDDFAKLCIAQRSNALSNPHALMKKPLTHDAYMAARPIADPVHLFDCVMPCAGAEAFVVTTPKKRKSWACPRHVCRRQSNVTTPLPRIRFRPAGAGRATLMPCGRLLAARHRMWIWFSFMTIIR